MLTEPYNPQMETETEYSQTSTHNICIIISHVSVFVVLIYEGKYVYERQLHNDACMQTGGDAVCVVRTDMSLSPSVPSTIFCFVYSCSCLYFSSACLLFLVYLN